MVSVIIIAVVVVVAAVVVAATTAAVELLNSFIYLFICVFPLKSDMQEIDMYLV